jgi:8-oxo-dGTP pyrophosphatase MutT (NUDIX family)
MKLQELFNADALAENSYERDKPHFDALAKTGFFGRAGAGCLFMARDTGRFLLAHRSAHVEQPGTFGSWGGAIDEGENPVEAVKREAREEAGYEGEIHIEPMFVFAKDAFRYYNFLVIVDTEFKPVLDWETDGFKWCEFGVWPSPLHFGLLSLFKDAASVALMQKYAAEAKKTKNDKQPIEELSIFTKPKPIMRNVRVIRTQKDRLDVSVDGAVMAIQKKTGLASKWDSNTFGDVWEIIDPKGKVVKSDFTSTSDALTFIRTAK